MDPILRHMGEAQNLLEELCDRADYGMVTKKSDKKATGNLIICTCIFLFLIKLFAVVAPFVLTKPTPRKLPVPTEKISTVIKANPVPKTLYKESIEKINLERLKVENRLKTKQLLEDAQKSQFQLALRKPTDKVEKVKHHNLHGQQTFISI